MIGSEASSITDESIVLTNNSTLILEEGGYIEAPLNTDWPAIRLTIGSSLIARGGYVNGSYADPSYLEGDYEDGGEAIHVNNGQSGPETARYALIVIITITCCIHLEVPPRTVTLAFNPTGHLLFSLTRTQLCGIL